MTIDVAWGVDCRIADLERWQREAVPYLKDFAQVRTITGQMQPHWDNAKRLLTEAKGE